jgi:hypothetical protein
MTEHKSSMAKTNLLSWIIWSVLKNGFYIFLSCVLLEKSAILLALLVYAFILIDLGFEFLRMVENA